MGAVLVLDDPMPVVGAVLVLDAPMPVVDPSTGLPRVAVSPVRSGLRLTALPACAFESFSSSM